MCFWESHYHSDKVIEANEFFVCRVNATMNRNRKNILWSIWIVIRCHMIDTLKVLQSIKDYVCLIFWYRSQRWNVLLYWMACNGNRDDHALCYTSSHHRNIVSPEYYDLAPYHNILCMQVNSSSQIFFAHFSFWFIMCCSYKNGLCITPFGKGGTKAVLLWILVIEDCNSRSSVGLQV